MQILSLTPQHLNDKIIIGFFDVLHHGHEQLFKDYADATILTFKTIPRKLAILNDLETRLNNLRELGFNKIIVLNAEHLNLTAQQFVDQYLKYTKQVIVGSDFIFGSDHQSIKNFTTQIKLITIPYDTRYSTSKIKQYLSVGEIKTVNKLLLKPFRISNVVQHGNHFGRTIGFPTINFYYPNGNFLQSGIYLTQTVVKGKIYKSLTVSIKQKDIKTQKIDTLETYILDFNKDLYGSVIEIIFDDKLGELKKCENTQELKQLIQGYVDQARSIAMK